MAYQLAQVIERTHHERIRIARVAMLDVPQALAAAVRAKLKCEGCTLDDDESGRRWIFNRRGELIGCRTKAKISRSKYAWQPGVRYRVDLA